MTVVKTNFFDRSAITVAKDLLSCHIVIRKCGEIRKYLITETEAYDGFKDRASHASRGKTKRNEMMFRSAGHIYVYFTYGMHWMLNIVTGPEDYPAAVLIRGVVSEDGKIVMNGPAKLTKFLGINGKLNGKVLSKKNGLWIELTKNKIPDKKIKRTPRIGVTYAGPVWANKKWRFVTNYFDDN